MISLLYHTLCEHGEVQDCSLKNILLTVNGCSCVMVILSWKPNLYESQTIIDIEHFIEMFTDIWQSDCQIWHLIVHWHWLFLYGCCWKLGEDEDIRWYCNPNVIILSHQLNDFNNLWLYSGFLPYFILTFNQARFNH